MNTLLQSRHESHKQQEFYTTKIAEVENDMQESTRQTEAAFATLEQNADLEVDRLGLYSWRAAVKAQKEAMEADSNEKFFIKFHTKAHTGLLRLISGTNLSKKEQVSWKKKFLVGTNSLARLEK